MELRLNFAISERIARVAARIIDALAQSAAIAQPQREDIPDGARLGRT